MSFAECPVKAVDDFPVEPETAQQFEDDEIGRQRRIDPRQIDDGARFVAYERLAADHFHAAVDEILGRGQPFDVGRHRVGEFRRDLLDARHDAEPEFIA